MTSTTGYDATLPRAALSTAELPALPGAGEPPLPAWPVERIPYRGRALAVRRSPGGPGAEPAVFVHGLGGAATNWTDLMALLAHRVSGAAPDLPGFGWSDPPARGDYSLDGHVRAVVRLIEHDGGGPVHLFGNSLGGAVSTRLAAERPDLVRSLTLVSPALPSARRASGADPRLGLMLIPGASSLVSRQLRRTSARARAQAVLDLCFADPSRVSEQRRREAVAEVERRRDLAWSDAAMTRSLRGLIGTYLERGSRHLWRQAATIRVPTLVVWGRHDRLVDVSLAPRLTRVVPDARLLLLEDSGHVAQLEHPVEVARAFLGMVDGVAGVAGEVAARSSRD